MYEAQEDVYYYITVMNENTRIRRCPRGGSGHHQGALLLKGGAKGKRPRVQLMGSGTILREVIAAADLLRDDWKIDSDMWSATSFNELRRDGMSAERHNLLHPTRSRRKSYVETALEGHPGPVIVATDYMRNYADQIRQHVGRRYVTLGTEASAAATTASSCAVLRGEPLLRHGRRAEGARRRRRDQGGRGRAGHQEIRARHRAPGSLDRLSRSTTYSQQTRTR